MIIDTRDLPEGTKVHCDLCIVRSRRSDLQSPRVDNLYVASSSVFPTSSYANPTRTIVAMALRLGDHLMQAR